MSFPAGFYTNDFLKPTATERTFLHGRSHHLPAVFKSILFVEAVRLRRLNECQIQYTKSLGRLQAKCLKLHFNMGMVDDMIRKAMTWTERFGPNSSDHNNKKRIVWATAFKNILSLSEKEKALIPHATIVYKRPFSLNSMITNYKKIAITQEEKMPPLRRLRVNRNPVGTVLYEGILVFIEKIWSKTLILSPIPMENF